VFPQTNSLPLVATAGATLYVVGFMVALIMWSFAIIWLVIAVVMIVQVRQFPFNMGWWGFIFPTGQYNPLQMSLALTVREQLYLRLQPRPSVWNWSLRFLRLPPLYASCQQPSHPPKVAPCWQLTDTRFCHSGCGGMCCYPLDCSCCWHYTPIHYRGDVFCTMSGHKFESQAGGSKWLAWVREHWTQRSLMNRLQTGKWTRWIQPHCPHTGD
jgi:hypothetical protein